RRRAAPVDTPLGRGGGREPGARALLRAAPRGAGGASRRAPRDRGPAAPSLHAPHSRARAAAAPLAVDEPEHEPLHDADARTGASKVMSASRRTSVWWLAGER